MEQIICDECKKIIREEGKWCLATQIDIQYKQYHFGEGMVLPWKEKKATLCSFKCCKKWIELLGIR